MVLPTDIDQVVRESVRGYLPGSAQCAGGWKLVPIEPTPEMLDARRDCEDGMDGYLVEDTEYYFPDRGAVRDFLACVYHGMLATAPAPSKRSADDER